MLKKIKLLRKLKLQYLKLLRMKEAPSFVARGYALGIFLEFLTLPTLGFAFLLLFPLVWLFRGSFGASIIGYIMGKFIMLFFLYWNYSLGNQLLGTAINKEASTISLSMINVHFLKEKGIAFFLGSAFNGFFVAIITYFLVYFGLMIYRSRKKRSKALYTKTI